MVGLAGPVKWSAARHLQSPHTPAHARTHLRFLSHQAFDELKLESRRLEERLEEDKRRLAKEERALEEKNGQDKSRLEERVEQLQAPREYTRVSLSEYIQEGASRAMSTRCTGQQWCWVLQH